MAEGKGLLHDSQSASECDRLTTHEDLRGVQDRQKWGDNQPPLKLRNKFSLEMVQRLNLQ
jgi:hypothetical protein